MITTDGDDDPNENLKNQSIVQIIIELMIIAEQSHRTIKTAQKIQDRFRIEPFTLHPFCHFVDVVEQLFLLSLYCYSHSSLLLLLFYLSF